MATESTITQDTAAPATTADAALVDTATTQVPPDGEATTTAATEDDAILSAIRGEEALKPEGDDGKTADTAATATKTDAVAKTDETGKVAEGDPKRGEDKSILDEEPGKDYKGRTRENFERLRAEGIAQRTKAQELEAKLAELAPNIEREANFTRLLVDSEGTPEDIGTAISLIRAVNKGSLEERRNALQVVNALRTIIADQIGEPLPDVDYLAGHADLKQRVADGDLSEADAREMAVLRRRNKAGEETAAQAAARERKAAEERQATESEQSARQAASNDVKQLAESYLARDGQAVYQVRVTYAQTAFADIIANGKVDPANIPALFRKLYDSPQAQMLVDASRAVTGPRTVAGVKPLMGTHRGGAGTAVVEAQSEEEAVLLALRGG